MKKAFTLITVCQVLCLTVLAQVKPSYLYNTNMPYGTLDLRTKISATNYYYLEENRTFSFRENPVGVRTDAYFDMTGFDSSPFTQGNLRLRNGTKDSFIMNYRLLSPLNYNDSYAEGYPLIVMFHGSGERGNCLYNNCYHSNWVYDPNVNVPAAPTTPTHKLLNNDHQLNIGGKAHLDARNKAAGKLPNDPTLPARAFPGFVLVPQMFNVWDSLNVPDVIRIVQLIISKYNIDQNRVYVHGLSIGGYAVYEAIKQASWLFAAALPISAVRDGNIFLYNQQGRVAHLPIWTFQGANDQEPDPAYTSQLLTKFRNAGAIVRYTEYADLAHNVWNRAYGEPDFFTWILSKNKANIHAYKGITTIDSSKGQYPRLMLAEGFFVYQWEKDGDTIAGATGNTFIAKSPGVYRARFSRVSAPTAAQWNRWSAPITIKDIATASTARSETQTDETLNSSVFAASIFPNPAQRENLSIEVQTTSPNQITIRVTDRLGTSVYSSVFRNQELEKDHTLMLPESIPSGIYFVTITQGENSFKRRVVIN